MDHPVKIPKYIPIQPLLEWAATNKHLYTKMYGQAQKSFQSIEASFYKGGLEMVDELIFILTHLKDTKGVNKPE